MSQITPVMTKFNKQIKIYQKHLKKLTKKPNKYTSPPLSRHFLSTKLHDSVTSVNYHHDL